MSENQKWRLETTDQWEKSVHKGLNGQSLRKNISIGLKHLTNVKKARTKYMTSYLFSKHFVTPVNFFSFISVYLSPFNILGRQISLLLLRDSWLFTHKRNMGNSVSGVWQVLGRNQPGGGVGQAHLENHLANPAKNEKVHACTHGNFAFYFCSVHIIILLGKIRCYDANHWVGECNFNNLEKNSLKRQFSVA